MEMTELELKLFRYEAADHLMKLNSIRNAIVLSEAGKAFIDAEIAELSEQIATMDQDLHAKKAQRLGWTRLRNLLRNLVLSIVPGRRSERKEATR
ncbi:hypothetical protein B9G55_01285 [Saccharibacillus sp. O16]|nr:hypothetical protein B9G55_01285 [Saccharibacillus sp. O16]